MDLEKYSQEELILTALKSEMEAKEVYLNMAHKVKNYFLKDRLRFLSGEEEKHWVFLKSLYEKDFPSKEIVLPEKTPVPLPQVRIYDENVPISDVLQSAMEAESAAREFYLDLANRFSEDSEEKRMLIYLSGMEMGHYKILEVEKENALRFEQYDQVWPMMHSGP